MAIWASTTILPTSETIISDGILAGAGSGALFVSGIDVSSVGDDGGWEVIASGVFPTGQGVRVRVQDAGPPVLDALCYSGIPGQGAYRISTSGTTLAFTVPPMPIGGPYDLDFESEDALLSFALANALTVVRRSFTDALYRVRAHLPPPRDVGPYAIDGENDT